MKAISTLYAAAALALVLQPIGKLLANHPSPLPDTINPPNNYSVGYTDNNPYNPAAPGPNPDMNYFPQAQAQNIANALSNNNAAAAGNPNGNHGGYTGLGFLTPDFGGTPRNVFVFDCSQHGGCDSGNAPADRINMPATNYISQTEACLRLVIGHELFHHVQYAYINFNNWATWGTVPVEGTARMMQDKLYTDLDANAGCITYLGETANWLGNPNQDLWASSYTSALFWNYLTEQLGLTATEPQRGTDFIVRFWQNAQTATNNGTIDLVGTLRTTISQFNVSDTLENLYQDFSIANYTKLLDVSALDNALRYRYRDENPGTADVYTTVSTAWDGSIPPAKGPQADSVSRWGSKYFVARPSADCIGVVGFIGDGDRAAYSLIGIKGADKVDRLYKSTTSHFARTLLQRRESPYTRLVAVVTGQNDAANFNYTFACGSPKLEIIEPTNIKPAYVGELNAPDRFLIRLNVSGPTELGTPSVEGLEPSDFQVFVGSPSNAADQATVVSGAYVQGQYWLVAQAPTKPAGPDTFPLFVKLGDLASDAKQNAVIYQKLVLDQVLVIDRSGSMLGPATSPKIAAARNAASLYVDAARSDDKIGVVSFSGDNVEPNDDATLNAQLKDVTDVNRANAKAAILGIVANGMTSIGDGMQKGANEFPVRGSAIGEDWLVLMSDGMENEAAFWDNVRPAIQAAGIRVNTIALGPNTDQALLQSIANQTNGTYYYVDVGPGTAQALRASATNTLRANGVSAAGVELPNRLGDAYGLANEIQQRHQRIWDDSGTIANGATQVRTIDIGEGGLSDAMLSVNWSDPSAAIDVEIERPDGSMVQDGVAGARLFKDNTHFVAHIGTFAKGAWTLRLTAVNGDPNYVAYLSGREENGAELRMWFGQTTNAPRLAGLYLRGLPMPVYATLVDSKGPVLGANIEVEIEHPDGGIITLPLLDDGNHGDGIAGDGLYGNKYTRTTVASPRRQPDSPSTPAIRGSYNVKLTASGKDNVGGTFTRISKGSFQIYELSKQDELGEPDIDQDGMPTRYELLHPCLDPAKDDAKDDADQDDLVNIEEWEIGTDPCYQDTDQGGEADRSELSRNANVFDPRDDALPAPVDPQVIDWVLDHMPLPDLKSESNLIRYPVHPAYVSIRLWRSMNPNGPFTLASEFDARAEGGLHYDTGLSNDVTYYYRLQGVDMNGNGSAMSHVFNGTPRKEPLPPRGSVTIAGDKPYVKSPIVSLTLSSDEDVAEMMISNNSAFTGASWEPFTTTRKWTLGAFGGYAMVYARFRDAAGNISSAYYDDVFVKSPFVLGNIRGLITLKRAVFPLPGAALHAHHEGEHDQPAADPRMGAMVWCDNLKNVAPTFTDETGAFELTDVPAGECVLTAQHNGYDKVSVTVNVVGGDSIEAPAPLDLSQALVRIRLPMVMRGG
jgi:von Willebrand factor type A domain